LRRLQLILIPSGSVRTLLVGCGNLLTRSFPLSGRSCGGSF
jgi:hypothetical protein